MKEEEEWPKSNISQGQDATLGHLKEIDTWFNCASYTVNTQKEHSTHRENDPYRTLDYKSYPELYKRKKNI